MAVDTLERPVTKASFQPDYDVWDCDHHYYEPPEAFLRHLPEKYQKSYQYLTINGRTKLAIDGQIQEFIPNPGFEVLARPGGHESFYLADNPEGKTLRQIGGNPIHAVPAFHNGRAHLKLMDDLGLNSALIFPTMAVILEEKLSHNPGLVNALTGL